LFCMCHEGSKQNSLLKIMILFQSWTENREKSYQQ